MGELIDYIKPEELTKRLGGRWYGSYGAAPCPLCQPDQRKDRNALTVNLNGGRLLLHCKKSECNFKDILIAAGITTGKFEIDKLAMLNAERQRIVQTATSKSRARKTWSLGQSIQGTKGDAYLRGRGITCELPDVLRWLPDIYHGPSRRYCAAMLANVTTGGLHRAFFTKHGKRLGENSKMMLGPCAGGAVRLSDSGGPLVVCEGIETGLSLLSGFLDGPHKVWAALSTSGISGLQLQTEPGPLIIASDGDEAGRQAADKLGTRAVSQGWDVYLMMAPEGMDWNDVLQGGLTE